jgi:hypothetical protein
MFRLIRRSSLVLVALAGLALLAVWGAAYAHSGHAQAPARHARVVARERASTHPATKPKRKTQPKHAAKKKKKATHQRTAFDTRADGICSANRATVRRIGAAATTWSLQQSELSDLVGATNASLAKLAALKPGKAETKLARRFIALTRTSISDFLAAQTRSTSTNEAIGAATESRDLETAQASATAAIAAQKAARTLRLRVCGSSGAEWL